MAEEDEDEEDEIVRPTSRTRRGIADLEDDETDEEDETMRKQIQRDILFRINSWDNNKWCKNCQKSVDHEHRCLINPEIKEKQFPDFKGYIFFDYEAYIDNGIYVPNLVMAKLIILEMTSRGRPQRSALKIPASIRASQGALRSNQNIGNSQTHRLGETDGLEKKLDTSLCTQSDEAAISVRNIEGRVVQMNKRLARMERQTIPANGGFSEQMIQDARNQIGLDLTRQLIFNGQPLGNVPFSQNNANLYGTRLLDIRFTREEQSRGSVELTRCSVPALDQDRIDLIKISYIKKLRSIEMFIEIWPSVGRSLKQKTLDARRKIRVSGEAEADQSADQDQSCGVQIPRSSEEETTPIRRDVTMHSLNSI
ncbi:unnamed protein product [Brachionus calyciflorus]|uniref:Uncharacterized protein n=1 Tax=Brachionus calyciflorus TaxID=104777 RepID=A0A814ITH9_9BILA|nr:unnamed protein product [Brachionus calyciflorus]